MQTCTILIASDPPVEKEPMGWPAAFALVVPTICACLIAAYYIHRNT